jgi:hypothetical protein
MLESRCEQPRRYEQPLCEDVPVPPAAEPAETNKPADFDLAEPADPPAEPTRWMTDAEPPAKPTRWMTDAELDAVLAPVYASM